MATQALDWASEPDESAGTSDDREVCCHTHSERQSLPDHSSFLSGYVYMSADGTPRTYERFCNDFSALSWYACHFQADLERIYD